MARRWEVAAKRASDGRSRDDWNTPHEIADLVTALFRGAVDLDPCGNPESVVPARVQYRFDEREENGLVLPWQGTVFVNPPFAQLREFARKASEEYAAGRAKEIVFLMPSRTDTRAWHDFVATAGAICFWRGRLTFLGAPNPAPFPVAFPYWGPRVDEFERVFGRKGMCVRLPTVSPLDGTIRDAARRPKGSHGSPGRLGNSERSARTRRPRCNALVRR